MDSGRKIIVPLTALLSLFGFRDKALPHPAQEALESFRHRDAVSAPADSGRRAPPTRPQEEKSDGPEHGSGLRLHFILTNDAVASPLSGLLSKDPKQAVPKDGGWTHGTEFQLSLPGVFPMSLGNSLVIGVSHDIYTPHVNGKDGDSELLRERPAGGLFMLGAGLRVPALPPGSSGDAAHYVQMNLGYRETAFTQTVQNVVHAMFSGPWHDYTANGMRPGWVAVASYGGSRQLRFRDDPEMIAGFRAGASVGHYTGIVSGVTLTLGDKQKQFADPGIPFLPEAQPLLHAPSAPGKAGAWRAGLELTHHAAFANYLFDDRHARRTHTLRLDLSGAVQVAGRIGLSFTAGLDRSPSYNNVGRPINPRGTLGIHVDFGRDGDGQSR